MAEVEAIDAVRGSLGEFGPAIGCVAGTMLSRRWRRWRRGDGARVASADLSPPGSISPSGDLKLFIGDEMELIRQLARTGSYLDGRYMATTFNLLRGRDQSGATSPAII
jgi:polyhydroxyalkanoate synthase